MILTWNHEKGPQIYVNGSVVGNFVKRNATVNNTNQDLHLQIGSGFEENSTRRGDCMHGILIFRFDTKISNRFMSG